MTEEDRSRCPIHEEKLKLFCKDELTPICMVCSMSQTHESHAVRPIEDAPREYKDDLEKLTNDVKKGCRILCQKLKHAETAILKRIERTNEERCKLENADISDWPDKIAPFIKLIEDIEQGCKRSAGDFLKDLENMGEKCNTVKLQNQHSTQATAKDGLAQTDTFLLTETPTTSTYRLPSQVASPPSSLSSSLSDGKSLIKPESHGCHWCSDSKVPLRPRLEKSQGTTTSEVSQTGLGESMDLLPAHDGTVALICTSTSVCSPRLDPIPQFSPLMIGTPVVSPAFDPEEGTITPIRATPKKVKRNVTHGDKSHAKKTKTDTSASGSLPGTSTNVIKVRVPPLKPWMKKYKGFLRLDLDTAHPCLTLSEGNSNVQNKGGEQPYPKNVKRFTYHRCVLGREGFTNGKHYWEVEVLKAGTGWCVGVAGESVKRNKRIKQSPEKAIWAVGNWDGNFAFTSPYTHLPLLEECRTLAMYLDYNKGQLSVYDADFLQLLHTFEYKFKEKLFPYFNLRQKADLRIKDL